MLYIIALYQSNYRNHVPTSPNYLFSNVCGLFATRCPCRSRNITCSHACKPTKPQENEPSSTCNLHLHCNADQWHSQREDEQRPADPPLHDPWPWNLPIIDNIEVKYVSASWKTKRKQSRGGCYVHRFRVQEREEKKRKVNIGER